MIIYCLKCKLKTKTLVGIKKTLSNGRNMITGICSVCGTKKSVVLSSKDRESVQGKRFSLNNLINSLPIEFHQYAEKGEFVPGGSFNNQQKYSFCGPGNRYEQIFREGYKGINELDKMCELHDQFYNENKDTKDWNISDVALAYEADEIARDSNFDNVQRKDARFISGIMKTKTHLGFSVKTRSNQSTKKFE